MGDKMKLEDSKRPAVVLCDACGYEKKVLFAQIPAWHMKACPECGHEYLVDDKDLEFFMEACKMLGFQSMLREKFPDAEFETRTITLATKNLKSGDDIRAGFTDAEVCEMTGGGDDDGYY
jgi:hypothetical protein